MPFGLTARHLWAGGLAGALVAGSPLAALAQVPIVSPAYGAPPAPSALTTRFLAEAEPTVLFLDRASALAADRAATRGLRAFARREQAEQAQAGADLAGAAMPPPVGKDPLDTAAAASSGIDRGAGALLSVLPGVLRTPDAWSIAADRAIAEAGAADLVGLTRLDGQAFDALYRTAAVENLRRLEALYRDYVENGEDDRLRAFSVHALPRVKADLDRLNAGHFVKRP